MDFLKIKLDPILHSRIRLSIISILYNNEKCSFKDIINHTKASGGNISVQLKKLQKVGYIEVQKELSNNYATTICEITVVGKTAFEQYSEAMKKLILG